MPIYLDWLDQPTEQDLIDLDKLYADAPEDWQSDDGSQLNAQWAQAQVSETRKLALGRFNDRVVVAAWLVQQSKEAPQAYQFTIEQLCVRSITRGRGVAKQLLVRLCQWANQEQCNLYVEDKANTLSGLYELGFTQHDQGWRYLARATV